MPVVVQRLYVPDLQWKAIQGIVNHWPQIVRQSGLTGWQTVRGAQK